MFYANRNRFCRLCARDINDAYRRDRQEYVDRIKLETGCVDCGVKSPHPEIYDFDHLPGAVKITPVADFLTSGTWADLDAEIAKCEIVCANCHRIRSRTRARATVGWGLINAEAVEPEPDLLGLLETS